MSNSLVSFKNKENLDSVLKKLIIFSLILGIMPLFCILITLIGTFLFGETVGGVVLISSIVFYLIWFFVCIWYCYKYLNCLKETRKDQGEEFEF